MAFGSTITTCQLLTKTQRIMQLEKTKITYHGNEYDGVYVTLDENEATVNTPCGFEMLFADISLWFDIVGDDRLNSDEADEPQDKEGEEIDNSVYYYDLCVSLYCNGKMPTEKFERFVLDAVD